MTRKDHIESVGGQLILVDPPEKQVERYTTEAAASHHVKRSKREESMLETANLLVDIAIKAQMKMFGVDRETARYWIRSASDVVD